MWNEVKLENGLWYLVDTTWDDQEEAGELYFLCGSRDYGMNASVTVGEERMTSTIFRFFYGTELCTSGACRERV